MSDRWLVSAEGILRAAAGVAAGTRAFPSQGAAAAGGLGSAAPAMDSSSTGMTVDVGTAAGCGAACSAMVAAAAYVAAAAAAASGLNSSGTGSGWKAWSLESVAARAPMVSTLALLSMLASAGRLLNMAAAAAAAAASGSAADSTGCVGGGGGAAASSASASSGRVGCGAASEAWRLSRPPRRPAARRCSTVGT